MICRLSWLVVGLCKRGVVPCLLVAAGSVPAWSDDVTTQGPQPRVHAMPPMPAMPAMPPMPGRPDGPIGAGPRREPTLGIATGPVSEQVRAQVDLPESMRLIVESIDPDGPAAQVGLKRFDILRKFDDQLLCNPEQLAALAKAAGKGQEVKLTMIHAGQEGVVTVRLSKAHGRQAEAGSNRQVHQSHQSQQAMVTSDGVGTVEIQAMNGQRMVRVKDSAGRDVYTGPLNTEADWQHVPLEYRGLLEPLAEKLDGPGGRD